MKIRCVACQTLFHLETDLINISGSIIKCLKCSYIFMVYPSDYCGSPVTEDTNIDQSILEDLLAMQNDSEAQMSISNFCEEGHTALGDNIRPIKDFGEKISVSNTDDAKYANLPDLAELEKMIDWDDLNDFDDPPTRSNQDYNNTQGLDTNGV